MLSLNCAINDPCIVFCERVAYQFWIQWIFVECNSIKVVLSKIGILRCFSDRPRWPTSMRRTTTSAAVAWRLRRRPPSEPSTSSTPCSRHSLTSFRTRMRSWLLPSGNLPVFHWQHHNMKLWFITGNMFRSSVSDWYTHVETWPIRT